MIGKLVRSLWAPGLVAWLLIGSAHAQVNNEQRAALRRLMERTREAGQLYTQGDFAACAEQINEISRQLLQLLENKDERLLQMAKPVYDRLARAHGLLDLEGAAVEPLPSWEELSAKPEMTAGETPVRFSQDVAPWLVAKCGNCHIDNSRGQFSLATFRNLALGAAGNRVIIPGDARGSRLVEVIESGDMPRGGGKVTAAELTALKKWIDGGAVFDGPSPDAPLRSYARRMTATTEAATTAPTVRRTTGKETVSFARDVAPILLENCNGCHIGGQQASGGLRMDTFTQLLRGGDSGPLIAGSNANESLLIKKLRGQAPGARMPAGGRPPLSDEEIELIATWIREGATFDGVSPETGIEIVVNQAWAANATHEELMQRRKERALARWSKAVPNEAPQTHELGEVFVLGNAPRERLEATAQLVEQAIEVVKRDFRLDRRQPLLRGGMVVFLLRSRYDYSEFGKMTEGRELPRHWTGHWYADPLDVYIVLSGEDVGEEEQRQALVLQNVAGAYLGAFPKVPFWFAEGVARNLVFLHYRRDDPRVPTWQEQMPAALQKVTSPNLLLNNQLDEESAGLVGMWLTSQMLDRSNRPRLDRLLRLMAEGKAFDDAFGATFGPLGQVIESVLGKPASPGGQR
ncbi:MAG: hypothetical protein KatS3mg111_0409 [Pirellulaceae bacterium]|nr:MAG: hypothetical protein KatS3mg111_0409 [Pirellulaceae bacterium]